MTDVMPHTMPSVQDLLDNDIVEVPAPLREQSQRPLGLKDITVERYLSREFHDLEVERVWGRAWQWACREEDIPNVGDHMVYDIADRSALVVRTSENEIKAYHNSCRHRGTRLKQEPGHCAQITCPFHLWSWNLDGTIRNVPARWDFPQKQDADISLVEVRVETWDGFVFVNFDPNALPLADYLDVLPEHFSHFPPMADRFTAVHVSKIMPGNWKIVLEAFAEAYHTIGTHPAMLAWIGDENSQYDLWETTNRMITPSVVASPHLEGGLDEDTVYHTAMGFFADDLAEKDRPELPDGMTARTAVAAYVRANLKKQLGVDFSTTADTEMLDTVQYFQFPNWMPWAGIGLGVQYRFRPNGNDPDTSIMDVRLMLPVPPGAPRPPSAPIRHLELDEPFTEAEEMGGLGHIFTEDTSNLILAQRGMKASGTGGLAFSQYQESRIRHFHAQLDQWIACTPPTTPK
jgi:nitrite reductase/ring-hydroxylating ferredoxin subunit